MFAYEGAGQGFPWWWIIPVIMMILCFLMMRRHRGGMGRSSGLHRESGSAREILDKRYALGEIDKEEYEEKRRNISQ